MIPTFPNFKKLQFEDKREVEKITANFPSYSFFNFFNLLIFSYGGWEASLLNKNLVLKIQYSQKEADISFIGTNKVDETIKTLIPYTGKINELINIPEIVIQHIKSPQNIISNEEKDGFDYIYSLKDLAECKGFIFRTKRVYAHRFINRYPDYQIQILNLHDEKIKKEILNTFLVWEKSRNKTRKETKEQFRQLKIALDLATQFSLYTPGVFIGDKLIAFQIIGINNNGYAMGYYEKFDVSYTGITAFLRIETAKLLIGIGCQYFNWETDLGLENLRNAKLLWHPSTFLKIYAVSMK